MIEGSHGAGDDSTTMQFRDAQQFDLRVWDANNAPVGQCGPEVVFAQSPTSRTLAAGESVTYVAHGKPSATGEYRAMAYLTSASHGAVAFATVSSP